MLRHCNYNWKVLGSNPAVCLAGFRNQPQKEAQIVEAQLLSSGEGDCHLNNGPALTVGQPNRSLKKLQIQFDNCQIQKKCHSNFPIYISISGSRSKEKH